MLDLAMDVLVWSGVGIVIALGLCLITFLVICMVQFIRGKF